MAQQFRYAHTPVTAGHEAWQPQGELFARLPRQLPVYKHGPEDELAPHSALPAKAPTLH